MKSLVLIGLTLLFTLPALSHAGYLEVSATGNYRKSVVNADNYQEMTSYTGSISYYFWELSALELSYTNGKYFVFTNFDGTKSLLTTFFEAFGLDLVLTLATKASTLQPYIKVGGAFLRKEVVQEIEGFGRNTIDSPSGASASGGLGFKINLSPGFAIKAGVDVWSSPLSHKPVTWDYAGRAGISWMF